jgi:glucose/arabinose dehydrogenase
MVRMRTLVHLVPLIAALLGATSATGRAATLPPGFAETAVASGLRLPTAMAISRDGRIFVAEQEGALRVVQNVQLLARPFVQLTVDAHGERGLLGVALHPDFPHTPYVYLYYTATKPKLHNRVSRFTARGNRVKARSEVRLLDLPALGPINHNGGALHFGPDGKLYVGVGENGVSTNAQSLATPLGKVLRIDADGRIPADNPFYQGTTGTARATWALGLRNPFTFAFSADGRMFINDVGQCSWEEIDEGQRGANYGWPATEGPTSDPRFVGPLFAYDHGNQGGCAITGGAFYDPPPGAPGLFPADFRDDYFYGDLCAGWIRRFDPDSGVSSGFAADIGNPVDLDVDAAGTLYYVAYGEGRVVRVSFGGG